MEKKLKQLPKFKTEDEEREFWATHDTSDYVDWSKAEVINEPNAFPNLRLSEDLIEFMIPKEEIENVKSIASKYHLQRHELARKWFLDALKREQGRARV
ncbi:MAG TPA: CopG family antitoxin [Candidatus Kapabacteria bacterium]|nr:CopG family antitoxin [Candidatus Kapabacteria bacterium]